MSSAARPIIIKKKGGHGGHHGGAWKVAYADFVTAMMALFIVLWLMNTSKPVKEAISGYFKDPSGTAKKTGSAQSGTGENFTITKDNMPELKEQLQRAIRKMNNFEQLKKQIEITVTSEGLRIELLESAAGTFFDSGSARPNDSGKELLEMLAHELQNLPNTISIEGHTDSKPFVGNGSYSNWELSADRANAARRLMQDSGVRGNQVSQVRGFADQNLRKKDAPEDPSNRRITILVQYLPKVEGESEAAKAEGEHERAEEKHAEH
ncbi:outer membrane protein, OmpA/MotB family [Candidatus Koribacter versatilis Ellin345]|uniref:Outer membrane protein, OmpA/MotB family n=1 Tax=Koribacter versatilis (strain Ellin345) TaxID=204669 RepID=Q1IKW7_KORVE|nr:flagellar motor protein MotB [Candidatus Koribacter versatilis]ABF42483.1 outer membrane protein, OmpA/MotB family [Candidatus Koribacter versatilis Ellin345]